MSSSTSLRRVGPLLAVVAVAAVLGYALGRDAGPRGGPEEVTAPAVGGAPGADEPREAVAPVGKGSAEGGPGGGPVPARAGGGESATASTSRPPSAPRPAAPPSAPLVVPAGTRIELELVDGVSSQSAAVGDPVRARLASAVLVGGSVALPSGAPVLGRVTAVHALRKVGGQAELALAFESVEAGGERVPIEAYFARTGRNETRRDAATIAAGAIVGTVLGNQARKNDRGKVVGGIVGAGVGTAIAAATEGEPIELGEGARLELTLRDEVEVAGGR
jgi:hypothetical protein